VAGGGQLLPGGDSAVTTRTDREQGKQGSNHGQPRKGCRRPNRARRQGVRAPPETPHGGGSRWSEGARGLLEQRRPTGERAGACCGRQWNRRGPTAVCGGNG